MMTNWYTANEKRLKALKQTLKLAADISKRKVLTNSEQCLPKTPLPSLRRPVIVIPSDARLRFGVDGSALNVGR